MKKILIIATIAGLILAAVSLIKLDLGGIGTKLGARTGGGGGGGTIGEVVVSGTAGSVLFVDGSGNLGQDNANFYWDDTANGLGIGTTTITNKLTITGSASVSSNFEVTGIASASQHYGGLGTAAAPTYTFGGDSDTGFYSYAANTIGFAINGLYDGFISNGSIRVVLTAAPTAIAELSVAGSGNAQLSAGSGYGINFLPAQTVKFVLNPISGASLSYNFEVVGRASLSGNLLAGMGSTATTSVTFDSGSATQGTCIELKDADGSGYTYCRAIDGVLNCTIVNCK